MALMSIIPLAELVVAYWN